MLRPTRTGDAEEVKELVGDVVDGLVEMFDTRKGARCTALAMTGLWAEGDSTKRCGVGCRTAEP